MSGVRKNKARTYRRRGVERATAELAVLSLIRDLGEVMKLHQLDAESRRKAAKNQRRQRSEEELAALSLARILESLAGNYPGFGDDLRKLRYRLLKRLTRPRARRSEILAQIENSGPMSLDDLVQCTLYDPPVVRSDIRVLVRAKRVAEINREGSPVRRRQDGRAVEPVFFGIAAAGPSQVAARNG